MYYVTKVGPVQWKKCEIVRFGNPPQCKSQFKCQCQCQVKGMHVCKACIREAVLCLKCTYVGWITHLWVHKLFTKISLIDVSPPQVELELRAQVRLFTELTGHLPLHMDGHQHVHVLPGNHSLRALKTNSHLQWIEGQSELMREVIKGGICEPHSF